MEAGWQELNLKSDATVRYAHTSSTAHKYPCTPVTLLRSVFAWKLPCIEPYTMTICMQFSAF